MQILFQHFYLCPLAFGLETLQSTGSIRGWRREYYTIQILDNLE